jgi:hypothetical protein
MEDWKVRQEIYHRLREESPDDLNKIDITITENVVEEAIDYFKTKNKGWIYPAKSYMVGICYSKWLSELFGESPMYYLNNPNLLYSNDPFFVPYDADKETYDRILEVVTWDFNKQNGMCPDVWCYFMDEFLLNA